MFLLSFDIMKIQDYIFSSNKLKSIVGGSCLVKKVTDELIPEVLLDFKGNSKEWKNETEFNNNITDKNVDYEIVFIGGGNTLILFNDEEKMNVFKQKLSKKIIAEYPGIQFVFSYINSATENISELYRKLEREKQSNSSLDGYVSFPISEKCKYSGIWATEYSKELDCYLSEKEATKLRNYQTANQMLLRDFDLREEDIEYKFDKIAKLYEGDTKSGYIALIHGDGNKIGEKIMKITNTKTADKKYFSDIRKFSLLLEKMNKESIKKTIVSMQMKDKDMVIRPIIYGGDDLTVVIDSANAFNFIMEFVKNSIEFQKSDEFKSVFKNEKITFSFGVTFLHSKYPFTKAYSLVEQLIQNAKLYSYESPWHDKNSIDWLISSASILDDLNLIREREYRSSQMTLTCKPYFIDGSTERSFDKYVLALKELKEIPASKYNKIIKLFQMNDKTISNVFDAEFKKYAKEINKIAEIMNLTENKIAKNYVRNEETMKCTPYLDLIEMVKFTKEEEK